MQITDGLYKQKILNCFFLLFFVSIDDKITKNEKFAIWFLLFDDIVKYSRSFTALPFYYRNIFFPLSKSHTAEPKTVNH